MPSTFMRRQCRALPQARSTALLQRGCNIVAVLPPDMFLPDHVAQIQPDMVIVDAESQARDTLEHVVMASRDARRPIVLFTDDKDMSHVQDAIAADVSAPMWWPGRRLSASNPCGPWRWRAFGSMR